MDEPTETGKPSRFQFGLKTAIILTLLAGAGLGGIFYAIRSLRSLREANRTVYSRRNMKAIGIAMLMYADIKKTYPAHLGDLYRDYVADYRCFIRPGWQNQEAGYMYIPGSTPDDRSNIVLFESPTDSQGQAGRNVLLGSTDDIFMDEEEFQERLRQTAANLKAKGIEMKPEPVKPADIAKKP